MRAGQQLQYNMLRTLLQGEHRVPKLMIVVPKQRTTMYGKMKSLFTDKMLLYFICPVTLQRGFPYSFTALKPWLLKALPAIKLSLVLLKVALLCVGIPVPALHDLPFSIQTNLLLLLSMLSML